MFPLFGLRFHFKEVNGFERVDLPRYFVPLTYRGQIGFRLGLHHTLAEHLPELVAAKLRVFRRALHSNKLHQVSEA